MKKLIIFGNSDFARLLLWYIKNDTNREVICFCADQEYISERSFCGLPVENFADIETRYSPESYEILIAIGNNKMNDVRKRVFDLCKQKGFSIASYIHSNCSVHSNDIGEGNIFLEKTLVYPFAKIGNGNLLWDHVLISHDCVVGDFNTFSSYADLCGYVTIGNNGYFGKHCILNDFVKIADYTLVGAAAYVKKDTQPYSVIVPAKSVVLEHKTSRDFM